MDVSKDASVLDRIEDLVAQEDRLQRREAESTDPEELEQVRARLREVTAELDHCWQLLRERRLRREP